MGSSVGSWFATGPSTECSQTQQGHSGQKSPDVPSLKLLQKTYSYILEQLISLFPGRLCCSFFGHLIAQMYKHKTAFNQQTSLVLVYQQTNSFHLQYSSCIESMCATSMNQWLFSKAYPIEG